MGRRPWSVDVITGVVGVPKRDESVNMLAFGGRDAEGIGGSPAVGAEGIRGKEFICVGTGADGIKAGFEVRGWDGCEGIGAKCAGSDATGNAELTLDWTGAEGIIADPSTALSKRCKVQVLKVCTYSVLMVSDRNPPVRALCYHPKLSDMSVRCPRTDESL